MKAKSEVRAVFRQDEITGNIDHLFSSIRVISNVMKELRKQYNSEILSRCSHYEYGAYALGSVTRVSNQGEKLIYQLHWGRIYGYDDKNKRPIADYKKQRVKINSMFEKHPQMKVYRTQIMDFDKKVARLNQSQTQLFEMVSILLKIVGVKKNSWALNLNESMSVNEVLENIPSRIKRQKVQTEGVESTNQREVVVADDMDVFDF